MPVKNLKLGDIETAAGSSVRRRHHASAGDSQRRRAGNLKFLKDQKLKKVQATIQGDQLRISSASKDELQDVIRLLRGHDFGIALQFGNYR